MTRRMTTAGDPAATEPKYYAVKRHLLEFIGSLEPGSPVPTERELATDMLETSRTTVRQALGELVVEGRLVRRQGSGTYVAEPKITWPLYLASFTEQVEASGFKPSAEVLGTQRVAAGAELAEQLGLPPRAPVYRIERLRFADAWPIAVETSWLPAERFPGLTRQIRAHGSLHAILADHYDTDLRTGEESIETAPATPREAGPLQGRRRHADAGRQPPELRLRRDPGRARPHLVSRRPRHARDASGVESAMTVAGASRPPTQLLGGGRVVTPDGVLTDAWVQVDRRAHRAGRRTPARTSMRPIVDLAGRLAAARLHRPAHARRRRPQRRRLAARRWSRRSPSTAATARPRRSSR